MRFIGLFCLQFILVSCQTAEQPDEVTKAFWIARAKNNLQTAILLSTSNSKDLLNSTSWPSLEDVPLQTGTVVINKQNATVETQTIVDIAGSNKDIAFKTYLQMKNGLWKVDYQQTLAKMPSTLLDDFYESLQELGDIFNQKLEQQIPLIKKELETYGQQLQEQIEEFNSELEKPQPSTPQNPYHNSI